MNKFSLSIKGEELILLSLRAVFWPTNKILIVSDLHLGKAGHFRKHGIAVSKKVHLHDLQNLELLIKETDAESVFFLGDLFHSYQNTEWEDFLDFIHTYDEVEYILIAGNHDILTEYPRALNVTKKIVLYPFSFTHVQEEDLHYNISGHVHPGVTVRGRMRMGMTFPCFVFSEHYALLPAFGQFTGIKKIKPNKDDRVFVIGDNQIFNLP
ncbi:MAG: ligase-associated DNA damage response endonuclease PdeM [Ekhidna sp.]|nr:ligase-associated DNA damage response endonuclease PdeM [Ekhidna sp.]MBC6409681.1 ligase-associated DNA damage response endonuclease PdeM [Ekhidna sp.]